MSEQTIAFGQKRTIGQVVGRKLRVWASRISSRDTGSGTRRQTIRVGGKSYTVFGAAEDPYFRTLQGEIENFPALLAYSAAALKPDSVVLDVGANIGLTTLIFCSLVPRGHVFAFEASPANAQFLRMNLKENGFTNCTVFETAVGSEAGETLLSTGGAGSHVMTEAHLYRSEWPSVKVPIITIDQAVTDMKIDKLDFIKMDIEGFEPMALSGAVETLKKHRPKIFMEFNSWSLCFAHRFDPLAFATSLWRAFEVKGFDKTGKASTLSDPIKFVHNNMTQNGCVDDLLLTPLVPFNLDSAQQMVTASLQR